MRLNAFIHGLAIAAVALTAGVASAEVAPGTGWGLNQDRAVQIGPRPYYLIENMADSPLKQKLQQCVGGPFKRSSLSIGHRGAALMFPEHTRQSYEAAAQMGAGTIECDVTFTKDRQLVCRHDQCDLHTTTDILGRPELAAKCSQPFSPADAASGKKASAKCCTSDITLSEFKSLCGKMDAANTAATTVADYMNGTAKWRTDLYATCGSVMTHAESIALIGGLGANFTPELKTPVVAMPFEGTYSQADFIKQAVAEYRAAGVSPDKVFMQSFLYDDILYLIKNEPEFAKQAVFLDESVETKEGYDAAVKRIPQLVKDGVKIYAPPLFALVAVGPNNTIVPSSLAIAAKEAGLKLITWSLERSGPLASGGGWYYLSINNITKRDGDMYELVHVLANDVGVLGIFSDWPATVTYYANCMGR